MSRALSVTRQRHVAASPAQVWAVVSDPSQHEVADPRCRLESATEERGVGSEFVLLARAGLLRLRLRYVVLESDPPTRWRAEVFRGGRRAALQEGELEVDGAGTVLRWTVTLWPSPTMRRATAASCDRELQRWLESVERLALTASP